MNPTLAQQVVDRVFKSQMAADATYTAPGGSPVACRVLVHRRGHMAAGAAPTSFHGMRLGVAISPLDIVVRASDVAAPVAGGVFTLGILTYEVGQAPLSEDSLGLTWRCPTNSEEEA